MQNITPANLFEEALANPVNKRRSRRAAGKPIGRRRRAIRRAVTRIRNSMLKKSSD